MKQSIYKQYQKAFSEVNYIIDNSEDEVINRIPNKLKSIIKENLDKSYIVNIDLEKGLNNCNLLEKTKEILYLIYRDYLCTKQENEMFIKNEIAIKEKRKQIYNIDNLFKNDNSEKELLPIVPKKKPWYNKVIDKIKKLCRIKDDDNI